MGGVGTESQPEKIALVGVFPETLFREVGKFICLHVNDDDGLVSLICLRAITVIQERSVVSVRAESDVCRESIERTGVPRRRSLKLLAGGELDFGLGKQRDAKQQNACKMLNEES